MSGRQEERKDKKRSREEKKVQNEFEKASPKELKLSLEEELATFKDARVLFPEKAWRMFDLVTSSFSAPTEIQAKTWGPALKGKDIIGIAATGSGKTLAFILPIVSKLLAKPVVKGKKLNSPRSLILAPTRELCIQSYLVASQACEGEDITASVAYGNIFSHQSQGKTYGLSASDLI